MLVCRDSLEGYLPKSVRSEFGALPNPLSNWRLLWGLLRWMCGPMVGIIKFLNRLIIYELRGMAFSF
jgi:hypothetical protein